MAFPVDRAQPICASWPREDLEKKESFFFFKEVYWGEEREKMVGGRIKREFESESVVV